MSDNGDNDGTALNANSGETNINESINENDTVIPVQMDTNSIHSQLTEEGIENNTLNTQHHGNTNVSNVSDEYNYLYVDLEGTVPKPIVYYKIKQALHEDDIIKAIEMREEYMQKQEEIGRGGFPKEFEIFKYEFLASKRNNNHVLDESKQCKRFLDLKYNDLVNIINLIQTSVIFTSTISGFLQATKVQFNFGESPISIASITIATYISLVLSISKYYALDDLKERIQILREKYSLLLNEIDYTMDKLGPWTYRKQWINSDATAKMVDWKKDYTDITERYNTIISTKKELTSEYEDIMDTKSRNYYDIKNKKLSIENKKMVYQWTHKEDELERKIAMDKKKMSKDVESNKLEMRTGSIVLQTEENDNWSFSDWTDVV